MKPSGSARRILLTDRDTLSINRYSESPTGQERIRTSDSCLITSLSVWSRTRLPTRWTIYYGCVSAVAETAAYGVLYAQCLYHGSYPLRFVAECLLWTSHAWGQWLLNTRGKYEVVICWHDWLHGINTMRFRTSLTRWLRPWMTHHQSTWYRLYLARYLTFLAP